jgi:MFS transporter, DHA2 family, multidrug resistance protein
MSTSQAVATTEQGFRGNDKLLTGIVLGVLTFWMFAGTIGTVARSILTDINGGPIEQVASPHINLNQMNLAVSITALFSGLFIVLMGGLADRVGRVRIALVGNGLGILGALLIILASGNLALPLLLAGRAIQGLSAACIMPSTMALVKSYWDGAGRQRAVSMWSIGSWGGSGFAALFGGFVVSSFNWRTIFYVAIVVSVISIVLIWGTPESRADQAARAKFDVLGLVIFMISVLALMIVLIFGRQIGWTTPMALGLGAIAIVGLAVFVLYERKKTNPFIDFALFRNTTFTGATISNFVLNGTIGLLIVSQQMLQIARPELFDPWRAGLLTIGYAVAIIAFIRVGEKLLRRFGPRKPDDLGIDVRRSIVHSAHADEHPCRPVHGARRDCLHSLRRGLGLLRDSVDRRCLVQSAPSRSWCGRRYLQDGIFTGRCHRGRHIVDDIHFVPWQGRHYRGGSPPHSGYARKRSRPPGWIGDIPVQPDSDPHRHHLDYRHYPQGQEVLRLMPSFALRRPVHRLFGVEHGLGGAGLGC